MLQSNRVGSLMTAWPQLVIAVIRKKNNADSLKSLNVRKRYSTVNINSEHVDNLGWKNVLRNRNLKWRILYEALLSWSISQILFKIGFESSFNQLFEPNSWNQIKSLQQNQLYLVWFISRTSIYIKNRSNLIENVIIYQKSSCFWPFWSNWIYFWYKLTIFDWIIDIKTDIFDLLIENDWKPMDTDRL